MGGGGPTRQHHGGLKAFSAHRRRAPRIVRGTIRVFCVSSIGGRGLASPLAVAPCAVAPGTMGSGRGRAVRSGIVHPHESAFVGRRVAGTMDRAAPGP